ncbi:MAG TPA: hypothetical protein VEA40_16815 [Ramlibacter sp.]|nr:hypothetical protein [Ramlibacter sp.]
MGRWNGDAAWPGRSQELASQLDEAQRQIAARCAGLARALEGGADGERLMACCREVQTAMLLAGDVLQSAMYLAHRKMSD